MQGRVLAPDKTAVSDYQGKALVQSFDSTAISTLQEISYIQTGSPLFRGLVAVVDGRFEATFRVPRDITYKGLSGRVSASVSSPTDRRPPATSTRSRCPAPPPTSNPTRPVRKSNWDFADKAIFTSGGQVPSSPVLRATISDDSGINITGETGHHIVLSVDDNATAVTHAFVNDRGDYRTGTLDYVIPTLEPGDNEIRLKAWDNVNNSATAAVDVRVGNGDETVFSDLLFHPNPLTNGSGYFTFNLFNPATAPARSGLFADGEVGGRARGGAPGRLQSSRVDSSDQPCQRSLSLPDPVDGDQLDRASSAVETSVAADHALRRGLMLRIIRSGPAPARYRRWWCGASPGVRRRDRMARPRVWRPGCPTSERRPAPSVPVVEALLGRPLHELAQQLSALLLFEPDHPFHVGGADEQRLPPVGMPAHQRMVHRWYLRFLLGFIAGSSRCRRENGKLWRVFKSAIRSFNSAGICS